MKNNILEHFEKNASCLNVIGIEILEANMDNLVKKAKKGRAIP